MDNVMNDISMVTKEEEEEEEDVVVWGLGDFMYILSLVSPLKESGHLFFFRSPLRKPHTTKNGRFWGTRISSWMHPGRLSEDATVAPPTWLPLVPPPTANSHGLPVDMVV
ncbi:hypothetical protein CRG98_018804 [Punica granatum]|uniref:Uncharacterized protein n=1 Tax=Punica granatum TaxID=22663 RepID=A0A2I0JX00_PUNGR|nr:hypothetical protein CRG98_018804 [Punica granatum]